MFFKFKFSIFFILLAFLFCSFSLAQNEYAASPSVVNLVNQGIEFHKQNDFGGAIMVFEEALSLEPNNKLIRQNLSIAHNNYGKYLAERTDYEKALKEFRYGLYYDEGNTTALSNLNALLVQRGGKADDPLARKQLGDKLRAEAEFELSLVEYKIADKISKEKDPNILIGIGDIHYILYLREGQKTDDIKKALDNYNEALKIKESAKAHIKVGDGLLGLREVVGAIEHYKKALDLEPENPEVLTANVRGWNEAIRLAPLVSENHIGLAQALQLKKDFVQAEEEYKQALKLDPGNQSAQRGLRSLDQDRQSAQSSKLLDTALKLQTEGKYDEAIKAYVEAVEINPNNAKLHYNIGTAFQAKGDFEHAQKAYAKALELDSTNEKAKLAMESLTKQSKDKKTQDLISRALELQNAGNYQEAITTYNAAISLNPDDSQLIYNLGTAYQGAGDLEKAKEYYEKAYSLDMSNNNFSVAVNQIKTELANPFIKSAIEKQQKGTDILGAVSDYSKALEYIPNDAQTHFNLATAYQAGSQLENAIDSYKKAVELDPKGQTDALFFIGTIYEEKKDNKLAISNYEQYMKVSPSGSYSKDAKERIDYLRQVQ